VENDDLNIKLDAEIKNRQKTEKAKKKIEGEFRATRTRLDEESATKTQTENLAQKLEEEIAKLKEDLDNEVKQKALIERVCFLQNEDGGKTDFFGSNTAAHSRS
jgi:hypothetical protein